MTQRAGEEGGLDPVRGATAARQWLMEQCQSHRLSPTQRRVAQSFMDTMPDAAFLSTSEAAIRAGVSQPTVTRFAATLGFASYAGFRAALRTVLLGTVRALRHARSLGIPTVLLVDTWVHEPGTDQD